MVPSLALLLVVFGVGSTQVAFRDRCYSYMVADCEWVCSSCAWTADGECAVGCEQCFESGGSDAATCVRTGKEHRCVCGRRDDDDTRRFFPRCLSFAPAPYLMRCPSARCLPEMVADCRRVCRECNAATTTASRRAALCADGTISVANVEQPFPFCTRLGVLPDELIGNGSGQFRKVDAKADESLWSVGGAYGCWCGDNATHLPPRPSVGSAASDRGADDDDERWLLRRSRHYLHCSRTCVGGRCCLDERRWSCVCFSDVRRSLIDCMSNCTGDCLAISPKLRLWDTKATTNKSRFHMQLYAADLQCTHMCTHDNHTTALSLASTSIAPLLVYISIVCVAFLV